ncbi:hypothetical protein FHW79_006439 [Azospirillum sp. OGB3]|uniref:hypothetical protein n=1 Tax=Azospirillum sp. OGB3 TaxID=2587012 RepID=UPI0017D4A016|nr:hypothetical protein [Azospirillum sp. OGB3]MBB3268764.1 hypothetical protein [Azospirillum sp. OGB3]
MADGMPPVRTIRSASDEAAAKAENSKAHAIRSASDEGTARGGSPVTAHSRDHSARPSDGTAAQAGRMGQGVARHADRNPTAGMAFGTVMASNYEAACSEIVRFMHQAAQRQSDMLNDMLRARSPSDVMLAGNRYLLGGLQAFFDTHGRIARASAHTAEEADRRPSRHAA